MLAEFGEAVGDLQKYLNEQTGASHKAHEALENAKEAYKKAKEIRKTLLQNTLTEKGLALCAERHYNSIAEKYSLDKIKNPTAEDLGIFPKDQLRLRFAQGSARVQGNRDYVGGYNRVLRIELLCSKHFSEDSGLHKSEEWPNWPVVTSELIRENEKFFLKPGKEKHEDVTGLIKWLEERWNHLEFTFKPEGNPSPDLFVFRHFGIPDLPEAPEYGL